MKHRDLSWLEQTYEQRRQRTVDLTTRAIAHIRSEAGRVSLAQISSVSKRLDEQGKGISSSAILSNPAAYNIYTRSREWKQRKQVPALVVRNALDLQIKGDERSRRGRLRKLTKRELVERLIAAENSLGEMRKMLISKRLDEVRAVLSTGSPGD